MAVASLIWFEPEHQNETINEVLEDAKWSSGEKPIITSKKMSTYILNIHIYKKHLRFHKIIVLKNKYALIKILVCVLTLPNGWLSS